MSEVLNVKLQTGSLGISALIWKEDQRVVRVTGISELLGEPPLITQEDVEASLQVAAQAYDFITCISGPWIPSLDIPLDILIKTQNFLIEKHIQESK